MPKIMKMDKRHAGHPHFLYYIKPSNSGDNFHNLRAWCWETWGPSKGLHDWIRANADLKNVPHLQSLGYESEDRCQNPHWCWLEDQYRRRIMFAGAEEVALYKLTYGS